MNREIELPNLHPRKSIFLIALGMGVYFLYLYHIGFGEVMDSLRRVNMLAFSGCFALALLGVLFDSLAWQIVAEKFQYRVALLDIFLIYLSSIFLNNLIPSGSFSGESARIYFLEKIADNSRLDRSSATVAATRIITAIPFFLGTLVGLVYLIFKTDAPTWALAACSSITLFLLCLNAIFFGICFAEGWLDSIINKLIGQVERIFHLHVERCLYMGIVRSFHESMVALVSHKKTLFISTFWSLAGWFCMTMIAYLTFIAMGVRVPVEAVFAVYAVMIFLQMLPLLLPGGVGLVDIVMITLFSAIGVPMIYSVAATILIRLVQLWFLTAVGGISTAYLVRKVSKGALTPGLDQGAAKGF